MTELSAMAKAGICAPSTPEAQQPRMAQDSSGLFSRIRRENGTLACGAHRHID